MIEKGHIFISYARADGSDFALKLYDDLEMRRINAWLDVYDINPGEDFYTTIDRGIRNAIALVVVLTPGAVLSPQVRSEWNTALNLHIPVIPLLVISCEVPNNLAVLNWIDFRSEYDPGIAALRRLISRLEQDHLTRLNDLLQRYRAAQKSSSDPNSFQSKIDDLEKGITRWKELFAKTAASLPIARTTVIKSTSLDVEGDTADMRKIFVGREAELTQLNGYLQKMLGGEMQVCFVAGDAGTGKTALITEFARHAHDADAELLYVLGQCNDITGMSDSYLPFRHVLSLLTGDESRLAAVEVDGKSKRLDGILKTTGRALVEIAPELVGTLIPGVGIIAALGRMGAKEKGLLKGLEEHAEQVEKQKPEIEQAQIFMQFTALLRTIAEDHPLVIVLDDLQWADMATIGLLFHLVRELKQSRILFVGLYRPGEIVSGRNGGTHPLKDALGKIFNEIKRYEADTVINLNKATQTDGRAFVDAVVDAFPNKLDSAFRDTLYQHTGGHALFTVELLAEMQDRGNLVLDDDENLIVSANLSWDTLPARVEAVVEERIERLTEELRETLTIASVEGTDFTAQVVSRVQELNENAIFRQLTQELEKRHQLVRENGEQRVGKKFLQRYTFSHAYFHRYLYKSLGTGQKRLLHQSVAEILEELYADRTQDIALQLAQHYSEAGDEEKAVTFFIQAGESASNIEEYNTAHGIFEQAADLLESEEDNYPQLAVDLSWWLGEANYFQGKYQKAQKHYERSTNIARDIQLDDAIVRGLIGQSQSLWQQRIEYDRTLGLLDEALELSQKIGNRLYEARALRNRGVVLGRLERRDEQFQMYSQSYEITLEINDLPGQRANLNNLGDFYGIGGNSIKSVECFERALSNALLQRSKTGERLYCHNLSGQYRRLGNYIKSIEYATRSIEISRDIGNYHSLAGAFFRLGRSLLNLGDIEKAVEQLSRSLKLSDEYNRVVTEVESRAWLALLHLYLNEIDKAKHLMVGLKPLLQKHKSKGDVFTEPLLEAIIILHFNHTDQARKLFEEESYQAEKNIDSYRWAYRYHYALAQAGVALLASSDEQQHLASKTLELYQQAVENCGWVGILDDAILILRQLRKVDPDDVLKPIEDYLVEKREIAWINRPFKD